MISVALLASPLICAGIGCCLSAEQEIVAQASQWEQLPSLLQHQPDVLIVESMEVSARQIISHLPLQPKIIVLGHELVSSRLLLHMLLVEGIGGVLFYSDQWALLWAEAITAVHSGNLFISESIAQQLQTPAPPSLLTERQIEILTALALHPNLTYKVMADKLGISNATLRTHLRNIYTALRVSNLTAALLCSFRQGLLPHTLLL